MRFESVHAHPFGPFQDETLRLEPGMNVVYGPNEAGKSSWHAALYAGLCGMRRVRGRSAEDRRFRDRHRPWDADGAWAVSAVVALKDGRRIELRRDLANKVGSAPDADLAGRDYANEIMNDRVPDGSRWLGLNRKSFLSVACVRQAQLLRLMDDAGALQDDLQRAAATAGTDGTAAHALHLLTTYRTEQVGTDRAPTKPLRKARERVSTSQSALEQAQHARGEYFRHASRVERLEREAKEYEREVATLGVWLAHKAAADAEQRAGLARELTAHFPDGRPHRSGQDDRVAQRVTEALTQWDNCPKPREPRGRTVEELDRDLAATTEPSGATEAVPELSWFPMPYLAAAGLVAGIVLALADFLIPGLVVGGFGLGSLAWWWLTKRRRATSPPKRWRRLLRQQLESRRDADRRYEEDVGRCEHAATAVRDAALLAGVAEREIEALVQALADWRDRRREKLAETDRLSVQWDTLQQTLAGQELAEIQDEAVRLRKRTEELAEHVAPTALAAVRGASQELLADAERKAAAKRADCNNERVRLRELDADRPSVADAEEALSAARREQERVESLDRTLDTTIDFLKHAQERVQRDIAAVLCKTVLEWLPRVTGDRYNQVKVDPKSLEVEVRGGRGPWRRVSWLSHGTAEQIYLLLRLALTRHLVAPGEVCPLILDDVVAACDADRKHVLLETLHAVSESTQVILFTHEKDVQAWARQRLSAPQDRLHELPPCPA